MSRGHGRWQLELLARVRKLRPGEQFPLVAVAGERVTADQYDSLRRAARKLQAIGLLRLDGERRGMVVRPPLGPKNSDIFQYGQLADSDTYRPSKSGKTHGPVSVGNDDLTVGLTGEDITVLGWVVDEVLKRHGVLSQAERESLQRVRDHFRSKR